MQLGYLHTHLIFRSSVFPFHMNQESKHLKENDIDFCDAEKN